MSNNMYKQKLVSTRDIIKASLASSNRVIADVFYGKTNPYKYTDEEMYKILLQLQHMLK